jgi:hypothetical protein
MLKPEELEKFADVLTNLRDPFGVSPISIGKARFAKLKQAATFLLES